MGVNLLESFIVGDQKAGEGSAPAKPKENDAAAEPAGVKPEKKSSGKKTVGSKVAQPASAKQKAAVRQEEETRSYRGAKRGRKRLEDPDDLTQISIRIPKDLYKRMRIYLAASDDKDNMTRMVRESLESYLDKNGG